MPKMMECPHCGRRIKINLESPEVAQNKIAGDKSIDELGLSTRARNGLFNSEAKTISDAAKLSRKQLLEVGNLGKISVREIEVRLAECGWQLGDS